MNNLPSIDWQQVVLNLSMKMRLTKLTKMLGSDYAHIRRLASGEVQQPRFNTGLHLLDLHLDYCPEKHNAKNLMLVKPILNP